MYTAVVLDVESHNSLKNWLRVSYPDSDWEVVCHHMTVHMGPPTTEETHFIGKHYELSVDAVGESDKAVAFRISSIGSPLSKRCSSLELSNIPLAHITALVNRKGGGKPVHSRDIKNWKSIKIPGTLIGTLQVCG